MFDSILGLPVHPLIVHATVVVVPLAALTVLLAAVWPRFRAWFAWGPVALAAAAVVLDPLSTQSGESLEHKLPHNALIERHSQLADGLLPWVIALLVGASILYLVSRRASAGAGNRRLLGVVATVICLIAAVGTMVEVVLIGHSGAAAAWTGVGAQS